MATLPVSPVTQRKSSLASPKGTTEPLTPAALRQAWILNKSRSETSLFPSLSSSSRRRIVPDDNTVMTSTAKTTTENSMLSKDGEKPNGNENPTRYNTSKASLSPMILAILDPVANSSPSSHDSTTTPTTASNSTTSSNIYGPRNSNIGTNGPPIAVTISLPQRSISRPHSRTSSVTSSTLSPSMNMLRWFQGTTNTPRAVTPASMTNPNDTNDNGSTNGNIFPLSSPFTPASPVSPTTGTTSTSRPNSKRSTRSTGGNIGSRSNSTVSFSTNGTNHQLPSSSSSSSDKQHQLARHRWKEGIITVMAANRFIQAAESRRERIANEEEIQEKLRQQRIIKERALVRKTREENKERGKKNTLSHPVHRSSSSSAAASRPNMRQTIDHLFHPSTSPNQITSYLWVGSVDDANDAELLQDLGISHILNTAKQIEPSAETEECFIYKKIGINDSPDEDLLKILPEAFEFIKDAKDNGGCVLVHCVAGISRSVAVTAAWLMEYEKAHLKNVMDFIRQRRPIALPNTGFRLALAHREIDISGGTSVAKLRHDPMWNFNDWRNEENQYTVRQIAEKDQGGYGTLLESGTPTPSSPACCIVM